MLIRLRIIQDPEPEHQVLLWKTINVAETKLKSAAEYKRCKTTISPKETPKVSLPSMKFKQSINKLKNKLNRFKTSRIQAKTHPI